MRQVFKSKPVFTAKLDTRNSFITGQSANIFGIKAGFSWKKTLTIGLGYNWLSSKHLETILEDENELTGRLKFRYVSPFIEYVFYRKGPWEAVVPVQVGMGKSFYKAKSDTEAIRTSVGYVMLYEPAMTVEYKVFNLIGFGAGVGYRLMLVNNHEIDERFTALVYMLRVRVIFEEVKKKL